MLEADPARRLFTSAHWQWVRGLIRIRAAEFGRAPGVFRIGQTAVVEWRMLR
jgi:hypothetical protein